MGCAGSKTEKTSKGGKDKKPTNKKDKKNNSKSNTLPTTVAATETQQRTSIGAPLTPKLNEKKDEINIDRNLINFINLHNRDIINFIVNEVKEGLQTRKQLTSNGGQAKQQQDDPDTQVDLDAFISDVTSKAIQLCKNGKAKTYTQLNQLLKESKLPAINDKNLVCDLVVDVLHKYLIVINDNKLNKNFNLNDYVTNLKQQKAAADDLAVQEQKAQQQQQQQQQQQPGEYAETRSDRVLSWNEANKIARLLFLTNRAQPNIHASKLVPKGYVVTKFRQQDSGKFTEIGLTSPEIDDILNPKAANGGLSNGGAHITNGNNHEAASINNTDGDTSQISLDNLNDNLNSILNNIANDINNNNASVSNHNEENLDVSLDNSTRVNDDAVVSSLLLDNPVLEQQQQSEQRQQTPPPTPSSSPTQHLSTNDSEEQQQHTEFSASEIILSGLLPSQTEQGKLDEALKQSLLDDRFYNNNSFKEAYPVNDNSLNDAATKIQASFRSHHEREEVHEHSKEHEDSKHDSTRHEASKHEVSDHHDTTPKQEESHHDTSKQSAASIPVQAVAKPAGPAHHESELKDEIVSEAQLLHNLSEKHHEKAHDSKAELNESSIHELPTDVELKRRSPNHEKNEEHLKHENDLNEAAVKIQSTFRGFMTRKQLEEKGISVHDRSLNEENVPTPTPTPTEPQAIVEVTDTATAPSVVPAPIVTTTTTTTTVTIVQTTTTVIPPEGLKVTASVDSSLAVGAQQQPVIEETVPEPAVVTENQSLPVEQHHDTEKPEQQQEEQQVVETVPEAIAADDITSLIKLIENGANTSVHKEDDSSNTDLEKAATKIQSTYRGYKTRNEYKKHKKQQKKQHQQVAEEQPLEDSIQIIDDAIAKLNETSTSQHQELDKAATKIQSTFRGYKTRKQIHTKKNNQATISTPQLVISSNQPAFSPSSTSSTSSSSPNPSNDNNNNNASAIITTTELSATTETAADENALSKKQKKNKKKNLKKKQQKQQQPGSEHEHTSNDANNNNAGEEQQQQASGSDNDVESDDAAKEAAATKIQATFRGYQTRRELGGTQKKN